MRVVTAIALGLMVGCVMARERNFRAGSPYIFQSAKSILRNSMLPNQEAATARFELKQPIKVIDNIEETVIIVPKGNSAIQEREQANDVATEISESSESSHWGSSEENEIQSPLQQRWLKALFEAKHKKTFPFKTSHRERYARLAHQFESTLQLIGGQRVSDLSGKSKFTVTEKNFYAPVGYVVAPPNAHISGNGRHQPRLVLFEPIPYTLHATLYRRREISPEFRTQFTASLYYISQDDASQQEGIRRIAGSDSDEANFKLDTSQTNNIYVIAQDDENNTYNDRKNDGEQPIFQYLAQMSVASQNHDQHKHQLPEGLNAGKCGSGPTSEQPSKNLNCYAADENRKNVSPGSCASYLQCSPDTCRWTEFYCPDGEYWNHRREQCVQRQEADCAAALFGSRSKVFALNPHTGKVIDAPYNRNNWKETKDIIVYKIEGLSNWNQVLVPKQIEQGGYFTLAFNREENGQFNVVTSIHGKPKFQVWSEENQQAQQWRIVPTDQDKLFQIVNVETRQALTVTNTVVGWESEGFELDLREPNQNDRDQFFRFDTVQDSKSYAFSDESSENLASSSSEENRNVLRGPDSEEKWKSFIAERKMVDLT